MTAGSAVAITATIDPAGAVRLELPEPPSANRWWRRLPSRGTLVKSREAREYQARVGRFCAFRLGGRLPIFPAGELVVTLEWRRAARRGDLDKRLGVLLDALQGTVYANDGQIATLHATRRDGANAPGSVSVVVAPLWETPPSLELPR